MQLTCPHCSRTLDLTGDAPSFCPYCGHSLGDKKQTSTIAFDHEAATRPPTDTPSPDAEAIPDVIGGYRLLRQIGSGGMGTVHEAEEVVSRRRVAVKLISRQYGTSSQTVERFRQEGRLASLITHPRCVFVLAADEEAGQPYIVMELMPGATLQDLVEQNGPLSVEQAVAKVLDIIEGLEEAHRLGVIHRDVKPSNCFLEESGRVKIGDFGLSKSLARAAHLTRTGAFLGTPLYASPEQVRGDTVDEQSDVYSVAATLYFLLTGQAPHQTGDAAATLARIVSDPAPSARELRPEVPANLDEVLLRGLERLRDDRWRNLADFREALLPFVPGRITTAGLGLRFGACLIDVIGLKLVSSIHVVALGSFVVHLTAWAWTQLGLEAGLAILYYAILEGVWGASLGKWLLGLRVRTVVGGAAPGVVRALARVALLYVLLKWGAVIGLILLQPYLPAMAARDAAALSAAKTSLFIAGVVPWLTFFLGIGLLFMTARARNGYRGLHEFLSGTRVVALSWSHGRKLLLGRPRAEAVAHPVDLPRRIGPYVINAAVRWNQGDEERVLVGEDTALGRKVWLWLRPREAAPLSAARQHIDRLSRLRCLASGHEGECQWHAFVAPAGCALADVIAAEGKASWPVARAVLEELTEELALACSEGTLPETTSIEQVWLEPNGRIKLIDMPVKSSNPPGGSDSQERALLMLAQSATVLMEGRASADARGPGGVQAPIPLHAADMVHRLLPGPRQYAALCDFQDALRSTRDRPREATRPRRMVTVAALAACAALGLLMMFSMTWWVEVAGLFYHGDHLNRGGTALNWLQEGEARELAAALAQPQLLEPARAVLRIEADRGLSDRLSAVVEYTRQEMQARETWAHPILRSNMVGLKSAISVDTEENLDKRLIYFREFAAEEADYRDDPGWRDLQDWVDYQLPVFALAWPALWIIWVFATRGGFILRLSGLTLVNERGQRAGRLRCAWRALLIWLPIAVLLIAAAELEMWYWGQWRPGNPNAWAPWLFWAFWWGALGLVLSYVVLALWFPARGPHDRLAGTYVVPR